MVSPRLQTRVILDCLLLLERRFLTLRSSGLFRYRNRLQVFLGVVKLCLLVLNVLLTSLEDMKQTLVHLLFEKAITKRRLRSIDSLDALLSCLIFFLVDLE